MAPGASCLDWVKLLVSEQPINSEPFWLPGLGEPAAANHRGERKRLPIACDWTSSIVSIVTRLPKHD